MGVRAESRFDHMYGGKHSPEKCDRRLSPTLRSISGGTKNLRIDDGGVDNWSNEAGLRN